MSTSNESQFASLYVLYSLSTPGIRWRWPKFPAGWDVSGSNDMMREGELIEEAFSGPEESLCEMRRKLRSRFNSLKLKGKVKEFKISLFRSIPDDGMGGLPNGLPP